CGATVITTGKIPPTSGDDASVINAAITACPAGDFVLLGPGGTSAANVSITANALTLNSGSIALGDVLIGTNLQPGTTVTAGSGASWTVSFPPAPGTTVSSEAVTAVIPFNIAQSEYIALNKGVTL